jgi:hypothetical protein
MPVMFQFTRRLRAKDDTPCGFWSFDNLLRSDTPTPPDPRSDCNILIGLV